MATRNLTEKYFEVREQYRGHYPKTQPPGESNYELPNIAAPPGWAGVVEDINLDLNSIRTKSGDLAKLHNERLKVTFGRTEDDLDKKIELMTRQITTLFRKCEASVKRVVPTQEELKKMTQPMSPQEVDMRRNVMKGMATKITDESKKFREMQKDFLSKMKKREDFPAEFGIRDDDEGKDGHITIEDIMEKGLTAEQVVELDALRKRGAEREAQIVQIAKSVNELAQMFKELSVLIVEQGSIIDRIDYNIEQAQIHVRDGVKEVQIAKKHQDKATGFSWFCIAALVIAIIVCIIILAEVKSKSS